MKAFAKGFTPYPKWCWVFFMPVGMAAVLLLNIFGNQPFVNALSCAWLSVGNIWIFGGLLVMVKGVPIAGYDTEKKLAFLEYPDGRRKYAAAK